MKRDTLPFTDFAAPAFALGTAHLARVTDVNDPESLARVKVELYAFDTPGDVALWARVASPFAGAQRGGFFIPQEGLHEAVIAHVGPLPRSIDGEVTQHGQRQAHCGVRVDGKGTAGHCHGEPLGKRGSQCDATTDDFKTGSSPRRERARNCQAGAAFHPERRS